MQAHCHQITQVAAGRVLPPKHHKRGVTQRRSGCAAAWRRYYPATAGTFWRRRSWHSGHAHAAGGAHRERRHVGVPRRLHAAAVHHRRAAQCHAHAVAAVYQRPPSGRRVGRRAGVHTRPHCAARRRASQHPGVIEVMAGRKAGGQQRGGGWRRRRQQATPVAHNAGCLQHRRRRRRPRDGQRRGDAAPPPWRRACCSAAVLQRPGAR